MDLEAAKNATSTTPASERPRCPGCGSSNICRKTRGDQQPRAKEGEYRCEVCNEHFDEPKPGNEDNGSAPVDVPTADSDRDRTRNGNRDMERFTLRIPAAQKEFLEFLVERGEYPNASEAVRSGIRRLWNDWEADHGHWRDYRR